VSWLKTPIKFQKMYFIADWLKQEHSMTALCARYGISRQCGYELIKRYRTEGEMAFDERSHARHAHPNQTSSHLIQAILDVKHRFTAWGPIPIKRWLEINKSQECWPAASTIGEILKRHGLVKSKKLTKRTPAHSEPLKHCNHPNQVWSADYKGHFRMKNQQYCYPLTISDNFSRYLLCCDGYEEINGKKAIFSFEKVFYEYGLPDVIRTDNGPPFASTGLGGLSRLSIWLLKLGVLPERIQPGHPEQNGRHERMHRTLKASLNLNTKHSLVEQQLWFNEFKEEFNKERPHQALQLKRPIEMHKKSLRSYSPTINEINYPNSMLIRKVKTNGEMKYFGKRYYVSELLHGEAIGLEMIDEVRAIVYFGKLKLGIIDARLDKIIRP